MLTEITEQANNKVKPNVSILSMAARQYLEDRGHERGLIGEGYECLGDLPVSQCERELQDYLRERSTPLQEEEGAEGTPPGDRGSLQPTTGQNFPSLSLLESR